MKAVFFDIKPFEKTFFEDVLPKNFDKVFFNTPLNENTEVEKEAQNAEILCVFISSSLTSDVLEKFKNLKFILTRSVGYSHIDLNYCKNHDIFVFNTPNYGDYTVAEYTFAILLYTIRNISKGIRALEFDEILSEECMGVELYNKTLGVIGAGSIGKKVLDIARGFNMKTLAYDVRKSEGYNFCTLDELFENSDIISINSSLTKETYHIINEETIKKMKDGVIIVNVARGEIIETQALYNALLSGKVSYAALDVIECEEILCSNSENCTSLDNIKESCLEKFYLNQKLLRLPNVTITPHMAYNTKEATERILNMTKENFMSCLNFNAKTGAKNLILL